MSYTIYATGPAIRSTPYFYVKVRGSRTKAYTTPSLPVHDPYLGVQYPYQNVQITVPLRTVKIRNPLGDYGFREGITYKIKY